MDEEVLVAVECEAGLMFRRDRAGVAELSRRVRPGPEVRFADLYRFNDLPGESPAG
ncbi:hypothetical protein ACWC9T_04095 [Kitasatospora sp. NPDC001159]